MKSVKFLKEYIKRVKEPERLAEILGRAKQEYNRVFMIDEHRARHMLREYRVSPGIYCGVKNYGMQN